MSAEQAIGIPNRIAIVVCPVCRSKAWSNVDLKPGHYTRGKRCSGKPETVMYLRERSSLSQSAEVDRTVIGR